PGDEDILIKLSTTGKPLERWCEVVKEYELNLEYKTTSLTRLMELSYNTKRGEVVKTVKKLYEKIR
ncbi:hypothetical protein LCD52_16115, partial [Rossellomorea vietnamensis]|uniref:hypothetical protein n=1 Tax=Rossellomorea vietnamensis TaxID=218284 RepID=UPI001CCA9845